MKARLDLDQGQTERLLQVLRAAGQTEPGAELYGVAERLYSAQRSFTRAAHHARVQPNIRMIQRRFDPEKGRALTVEEATAIVTRALSPSATEADKAEQRRLLSLPPVFIAGPDPHSDRENRRKAKLDERVERRAEAERIAGLSGDQLLADLGL